MRSEYRVKIRDIRDVTHDVKEFIVERPKGYAFVSGQHTLLSYPRDGIENVRRAFSFASAADEDYLSFIIKIYPERDGVTARLDAASVGDEVVITDAFGKLQYKGPGLFITAGSGITPFYSILSMLKKQGKLAGHGLLFSNRTARDIILRKELEEMLGNRCIFTLTREEKAAYEHGHIDLGFVKRFMQPDDQYFYICGPPKMVIDLKKELPVLGISAERIITE
jgi:hypothetical protein